MIQNVNLIIDRLFNPLCLTARTSYIEKDKNHPIKQKRCIIYTTEAKKIANKRSRM